MRRLFVGLVLFFLVTGFFVCEAGTAIYKYVDKNGIVCFADNLQAVPENYRNTAVIMPDESSDEPRRSAVLPAAVKQTDEAPVEAETKHVASRPRPLGTRIMISGVVVITALLAFVSLSRLPQLREKKKILSAIRGGLIAVVSLFILVAHVKDLINGVGAARGAVEDVQNRSAQRGKKAGQAIKTLNELLKEQQSQAGKEPSENQR